MLDDRVVLPWPEPLIPPYRAGRFGRWTSKRTPELGSSAGYFVPHKSQSRGWMFQRDGETWMSLTRMEVESHMPHLAAMRGHVVIAGLGMGFALYNALANPAVTRVTVLESDPDVPRLLDRASSWRRWPGRDRLRIVMGDATEYVPPPNEPLPDFLYADVWPKLGDFAALPTTQRIQRNVRAAAVGYWGQEWDFLSFLHQNLVPVRTVTRNHYRAFVASTTMPLIERDSMVYPRLAMAAVTLQLGAQRADRPYDPQQAPVAMGIYAWLITHLNPLDGINVEIDRA